MFGSISCSISTYFLDWFLQNSCWVCKAYFIKWWQNIWISKMFLSLYFHWCRVLNFRINSCLWCISDPLTDKNFVLFWEKVWALTLSHIIDPMPLKMITTSFSQHSISTSFTLKPHALIDIAIFVDHSTFTMGMVVHPHTVISVSWFVKHCAPALFLVGVPISSVLSS